MGTAEHLSILQQGVEAWNAWMKENPRIIPDLEGADLTHNHDLRHADLTTANLIGANLETVLLYEATLRQACLIHANLRRANLAGADLTGAELGEAELMYANLTRATLTDSDCRKANFGGANLRDAVLTGADLEGADLSFADLRNADLTSANLTRANLVEANLEGAKLINCRVYGTSVWNLKGKPPENSSLIITRRDEPTITVESLDVAQFIYLLLNNERIRDVIHTIGQKGILILGRFALPERKVVLDRLRLRIRELGFVPIMFDFEGAAEKDFTETIRVLAGLSLFVIVDLTNPRSSPLELQATVPDYKIPFVPIIQKGEEPFSMFRDLASYPWVMKPVLAYDNVEALVASLEEAIIKPAVAKHHELVQTKMKKLEIADIGAFRGKPAS